MLSVGIIVALALIYFVGFGGVGYHPGELLIILLLIALIMLGARLLYRRERRKYWQEYRQGNEAAF
jgi:hypothetical protein